MADRFSLSEIVELGIQIEKNGRDFYAVLAKKVKNSKIKKLFGYLEEQEKSHIITFEKLLDSIEKYQPTQTYPNEYFEYMNAIAGGYVFTQKNKGREIAKSIKESSQAVDMAIGFEKDSIIFYQGMKKILPDKDTKVIDDLITQEQLHLLDLLTIKKKLLQGE